MFQQSHISQSRYEAVLARYKQFIDVANDPSQEPVMVYNPLTAKQLEELVLIREVSQQLQSKKEDDLKKATQAKEAKTVAEEKKDVKEDAVVQEETKTEE